MKQPGILILALLSFSIMSSSAATFIIDNIVLHDHISTVYDEGITMPDPANSKLKISIPQVEVNIEISKAAESANLMAKAYYYDEGGKLIQAFDKPSIAQRFTSDNQRRPMFSNAWPTLIPANVRQKIFFPMPKELPATWSLVVVFGNKNGVTTASIPDGQDRALSYPERDLAAKTLLYPDVALTDIARSAPLIEQKVQSDNPRYPAFTLVMHLPHGVTNPKDVSGVLTTCMVVGTVDQIRDKLNAIQPEGDPNPYFAFAESHKMAIIAWGSRWVWSSYANFDELDKNQIHAWDENFQQLADAWDRGIQALVQSYGIPDHDYLMYGLCAGGEWAHRLALHKPERFLAVQMHISTSYDEPTPEARHIMWLLTTGELDNGCDRARRFYGAARNLGYPIIFKAVEGLGHGTTPMDQQLGIRFFEYALAEKTKRDASNAGDLTKSQALDLSDFYTSPFYGDLMNQDMFAAQDKEMIPAGFLVPLPSREIADAWNQ